MDDFAVVVKQDGGDEGFALCFLLLGDHGVEASDGVRFQSAHGAAAVQDKNDFRKIFSHVCSLH